MITFTRLCSNSCCAEILYRRWSLTAFSAFDVFHDNIVEASVTTSLNNIVEQHRSLCSLVRCPSQHSKYFKFHTSAHACIILYVIIIILIIISHYYCACYHVNMFTMRINKYTFLTKHILTDFLIIFLTINPNQPCQLSLWEETGEPGENPRLSAASVWRTLPTCDQMFDTRLEPTTSVVGGRHLDDWATVSLPPSS